MNESLDSSRGWVGSCPLTCFPSWDNYVSWSKPKLPLHRINTPTLIPYLGPVGPFFVRVFSQNHYQILLSRVNDLKEQKKWSSQATVKSLSPGMCYREPVSGFIYMAVTVSASFPPREPQYKLYCLVCLLFRQTRWKQHVPHMSNTIICRLLLTCLLRYPNLVLNSKN